MKVIEPEFRKITLKTYKYILLCVLIPIVCFTFFYQAKMIYTEKREYEKENTETADACLDVINNIWKTGTELTINLSSNSDAILFNRTDRSQYSSTMLTRFDRLMRKIWNISNYMEYVEDIVLVFYDPVYYVYTGGGQSTSYVPEYSDNTLNDAIRYTKDLVSEKTDSQWDLHNDLLYCYLRADETSTNPIGCSISFNCTQIRSQLRTYLNENQYISLTDEDGHTLLGIGHVCDTIESTDITHTEDGWHQVIQLTVPGGNWNLVFDSREDRFQARLSSAVWQCFLLLLLLIVLTAILALVITITVCRPYRIIANLLTTPVQDAHSLQNYADADDLGIIHDLITETKYQLFAAQNEMASSHQLLKSAQFLALQSQISPHFLHNTLESINWKAIALFNGKDNEVSDMVCDLSLLMRLSMKTDEKPISLREEIDHAKVYLRIQQHRFPDCFNVQWDIPDAYLNTSVIAISLQPLLENAISHGIKRVHHFGLIRIQAVADDQWLHISVIDNGFGFSEASLKQTQAMLAESVLHTSEHVGLFNVNQRIKLAFPGSPGVTIDSSDSTKTVVTMHVPYQPHKK